MLLRDNCWPSRLVGALLLLSVLLSLCGPLLAKKPKQKINTSCTNTNKTDEFLYYVERPFTNDTACTRYAWSTVGYPTLFISQDRTKCDCRYSVNESEYFKNQSFGSVKINGTGSYFSLAIVFTRLIEFQVDAKMAKSYSDFDVTKACDSQMDSVDEYNPVDLSFETLKWKLDGDSLVGYLIPDNISNKTDGFSITIKTHFPSAIGMERLGEFPRAQISENATLIDIAFQKFNITSPDDSDLASRLALEMYIIHGPKVKNGSVHQDQSIDDEYTPSVFSTWTYNVSGNDSKFHDLGGYLHWKPISYQDPSRKSTESQQVNVVSAGDTLACLADSPPLGLAMALFGDVKRSNMTRWFAVFGTDGDDTYLNSHYSTWTLVVGYGTVPHDGLSFTVIITIIVGLGIPGALVILGGVYVFIKKKPWQNVGRMIAKAQGRSEYQTLD